MGVFLVLGAALGPFGLGLVDIGLHSDALHALGMLGLALVLFSDAVTIDRNDVRERWRLLLRILGPGTVIPAILVALAARLLLELPWAACAILGAALASTDPVLLRAVIRSRTIPETSRTALRMESGTNDVVLLPIVVLAMLALPAAGRTGAVAGNEVARHLVGLFLLGPAIGALVGWLGIILLARIRSRIGVRRDYESLYALGLAFSGFALAEGAGGSGFLAAFAAGLMVSWQDVELCDCFTEYGEATAEMLLLLTFVALGTSQIWSGVTVIGWNTILFALIALTVRTVVLYPVLMRARIGEKDRKIIAFFGPRGLSSLLLVLLPVFANVEGSAYLFAITSLVVLSSVAIHGGGIALYMRAHTRPVERGTTGGSLPVVAATTSPADDVPDKITIAEVRDLQARGEELVIADVRKDRNLYDAHTQAAGAIRLRPEDPVRDATELRLSQRATLVVYCA